MLASPVKSKAAPAGAGRYSKANSRGSGRHGRRGASRQRRRSPDSHRRRGGGRSTAPSASAARAKISHDPGQEPRVRPQLAHIPHHDASETSKRLAVRNRRRQGAARGIPRARGARVRGNAQQDLDVRVRADGVRPRVPRGEVEVVLRRGARDVALHAAVVVVELDLDEVEVHRARQHLVVRRVRVRALRRGAEVVGFVSRGRGDIHERAQLLAEGGHVLCRGLEVEVEAVHDGGAEWAVGAGAGVRAEHGPDVLRCGCGGRGGCEAAFGIGCPADRQHDGLAICALAFDDVLSGWCG